MIVKTPFSQAVTAEGDLIYAYTRREAIEDGHQIELTEFHGDTVREAGIKFRLFCTSTVYRDNVCPIEGEGFKLAPCQDPEGRLWDLLTMLVHGIRGNRDSGKIHFSVMVVPNIPEGSKRNPRAKRVYLLSTCGPVDIDDPAPALTIMYPGEE